ncbi:hypothetical protein HDU87_004381 [Geranomyces variabilis]|uniref:Uncharacterized protein n=1 Tax=Geranomyces variabilis TaxID=109894 RepID=A0AAD5XMK4_9FUNG|nr:hypothetical protein HDU87_004381 [Geranomyces variabilis]
MSAHYVPPLYPPHHLLPYWHQPPGGYPMYATAAIPHFPTYSRMPLHMHCGLSHRPSESALLRNCIPPAADAYSYSDSSLNRYPPAAFAAYAEHATVENDARAEDMPRQLTLADSCNGVKTYVNPGTNRFYAFCRHSDTTPPTFLPALSRVLYNTSMPSGVNVIVEDPEGHRQQQQHYQPSSRRADRRQATLPQPAPYGKRKRGNGSGEFGRCDCVDCGDVARPTKMLRAAGC